MNLLKGILNVTGNHPFRSFLFKEVNRLDW